MLLTPPVTAPGAVVTATSVTLPVESWSNLAVTAVVAGATASNIVDFSPEPSSLDAFGAAEIRCTAQGTNTLTFTCSEVPETAVTINVMLIDI